MQIVMVTRFRSNQYSRTMTPLARFGGFAWMPSIAMTREATPGLRYRPRFRSLTWRQGLGQRRTARVRFGWLPTMKVCFIGKGEPGSDLNLRQNSQSYPPQQLSRTGGAVYGSGTMRARSLFWNTKISREFFPLRILQLEA